MNFSWCLWGVWCMIILLYCTVLVYTNFASMWFAINWCLWLCPFFSFRFWCYYVCKIIYKYLNIHVLFFIYVHKFILFKFNKTSISWFVHSKQELELGVILWFQPQIPCTTKLLNLNWSPFPFHLGIGIHDPIQIPGSFSYIQTQH